MKNIKEQINNIILEVWKRGYAWTGNSEKDFKDMQSKYTELILNTFKKSLPKMKKCPLGDSLGMTVDCEESNVGFNKAIIEIEKTLKGK